MEEQKPQQRQPRVEITPTGIRVEYWPNDHGGEDVVVHLPMIESDAEAEDIGKAAR